MSDLGLAAIVEEMRRHKLQVVIEMVPMIDQAETGKMMREERKKAGLTLREMARQLKCSAPFVSDLELGRRRWTQARVEQWEDIFLAASHST